LTLRYGLQPVRVLFLVLGQAARVKWLEAVLETWARELHPNDAIRVLGDRPLVEKLGAEIVWECVEAGGPDDVYSGLPRKVLQGLRRARDLSSWDVIAKLDDDTLVSPARLRAIAEHHLDPAKPLYFGGTGFWDFSTSHWIVERGLPSFRFFYFAGGGCYFLTRPALEQSFAVLEQVMDAHGVEDGYIGAALAHSKVPCVSRPELLRHFREPDRLLWSCAATSADFLPQDLRVFHRLLRDRPALPFTIVDADVSWGMPGLHGMLGYENLETRFRGERVFNAISAHAPSRVVLAGEPGASLRLQGALNDSVPEGHAATASFTIDGAELGEARAGKPTEPAHFFFPASGKLELRIATRDPERCHSMWLHV
jgi:hypothetical protein